MLAYCSAQPPDQNQRGCDRSHAPAAARHHAVSGEARARSRCSIRSGFRASMDPPGPIEDLAGIKITAQRQADSLAARRCQHVRVPHRRARRACPRSMSRSISFRRPKPAAFPPAVPSLRQLAVLSWNQFLLYPKDMPSGPAAIQGHAEGSGRAGAMERRCRSSANPAMRSFSSLPR